MKKRMQILMSLTLTAFLFLGLTSVNAQSLSAGPVYPTAPNDKTTVELQTNDDAISTVQTEIQTNYDLVNPPSQIADAEGYYRLFYLRTVKSELEAGQTAANAIYFGYVSTVDASKASNPNLVNETWQADMVALLAD
ncbi:MAG: hypothetical protein AB8F74_20930 [Saprospiraceae bacterium]